MSVLSDEQIREIVEPLAGHAIPDSIVAHFRAVADAAVQAEMEGQEPVAWASDLALSRLRAGWPCTAVNVASKRTKTCHNALYTAPPAAPVVLEDIWKPVLEAVMREMPKAARYYRLDDGNAPGHAHQVAGIWDSDNGDLAGKPCAWCLAWNTARAMLAAAPAPSQEQTT